MVSTVTSYSDTSATTAVNQVLREYDDFGLLEKEYQEHSGEKDGSSLYVGYNYAGAADGLRLQSVRYPNGRLVHYTYGSAGSDADNLSRLDAIKADNSGTPGDTLASYTYLGLGTVVREDYEEPDVRLDLWGGTSGTYQGFDRFGRVVDHLWRDYGASSDADRFKYGYDRAGNRLWKENDTAANLGTPVHLDELYDYDEVYQLIDLQRGNLNANHDAVTDKVFAEDWDLDATGNWEDFRQDDNGNGTWDLDEQRAHNDANEITQIEGSSSLVSHDRAGNMTKIPMPADGADDFDLTYDAWNRLVKVEDGENTVAEYEYTGDNRRVVKDTYSGGEPDETRHFYYTDQWQCIEERATTTTPAPSPESLDPDTQYVWGDRYVDDLILRDRDTTANGTLDERLYALQDANWNVTALAETDGTIIERYTYTAYGALEVRDADFSADADGVSDKDWVYTYTTRRLDGETGLMYYRNRMYHAALGRFVSRDPVGNFSITP